MAVFGYQRKLHTPLERGGLIPYVGMCDPRVSQV